MIFRFAVKYPFIALAADRKGSPKDKTFRQNEALSFFRRYFAAGSANMNKRSNAKHPKINEYPKQHFIILLSLHSFFASFAEIILTVARLIPEAATVQAGIYNVYIN